jgi:3'(2'), 5'-bisphosphate nucleotidase
MHLPSTSDLLLTAIRAAYNAGKAILEIYGTSWETSLKTDQSPLTTADLRSHEVITAGLHPTGIPVLSEEGAEVTSGTRMNWKQYWLVDPLDGTKEFINRNGEFTVNIALMAGGQPVAGVIYIPVAGLLYFGSRDLGSFRIEPHLTRPNMLEDTLSELLQQSTKLPAIINSGPLIVLASRSHLSFETAGIIQRIEQRNKDCRMVSVGSSLKFCRLAEGSADFYPRFGPTMEWDTAAGQAIAENAGIKVLTWPERQVVKYNKSSLLNPWFIAYNPERIDPSDL